MLPVTRANLDNLCSTCLIDMRPSVYTQKVYYVDEELNLSKWLKLTAHITVLRNPMNQKYIEEYCKKLCEICFLKAQYSYDFRENILAGTIAVKDILENEKISEDYLQNLHKFCRICLNRSNFTQEQPLTMEYLKWLKDGSGLNFTTLDEKQTFRLKEGTNITELMLINDAQFPRQICKKCLKRLRTMQEFRKLATQSFEYMVSVMGDADKPMSPIVLPIQLRNLDNKRTKTELLSLPEHGKGLNAAKEDEMIFEDVKDISDDIKIEQVQLIETAIEQEEIMYPGEIKISENSDHEMEQMIDERGDFYIDDDHFNGYSSEDESSSEDIPIAKLKNIESVNTQTIAPTQIESNSIDNDPIAKTENLKSTTVHKKLFRKSKKVNIKGESELADPSKLTKKQSKSKKHVKKVKKQKDIDTDKQNIKNESELEDSKDLLSLNNENNDQHNNYKSGSEYELEENDLNESSESDDETKTKAIRVNKPKADKTKTTKPRKPSSTKKKTQVNCDECGRKCLNQETLERHKRTHLGLKPFQCPHCDRGFDQSSHLDEHIYAAHNEDKEYIICKFVGCGKKYSTERCYNVHFRRHHLLDDKLQTKHICEDCGMSYTALASLRKHQFTHKSKDQYPYQCTLCDKAFIKRCDFETHQLRHAGIKNFVCPHCGLKKTTNKELQRHINYHTKEKQFPCPHCPTVCSDAGNLRRHEKIIHQGFRPHACKFCEKTFGKQTHLKRHEMLHTGERPHVCAECGKGFIEKKGLNKHMNTHNKYLAHVEPYGII